MTALLEVCAGDAESLEAAIAGGAQRVELCSALELGGLTPSPGLMALAARAPVPVNVLIRPRGGDFVYASADIDAMLADIEAVRRHGLAGVVLGASRPDGTLDEALLDRLSAAAGALGRTLHRAIDLVPDFAAATEVAVALGFERVLSSGGQRLAVDGVGALRTIHRTARGRLAVMAGAGLTPANVGALLGAVPVDEVHSSCSSPQGVTASGAVRLGFGGPSRRRTSATVVAAFRQALRLRA